MFNRENFAPSKANMAFANQAIIQLDGLAQRRKLWESTEYRKANEILYDLLADKLALYKSNFVNASDANKRTLRHELIVRLTADGIRVQNNTTILIMGI